MDTTGMLSIRHGGTNELADITANLFIGGLTGCATSANKIDSQGVQPNFSTGDIITEHGISLTQCYTNGYPINYGNIINIQGDVTHPGVGQLLCGWTASYDNVDSKTPILYRNKSDNRGDWSKWFQLAFMDDVTAANEIGR